MKWLLIDSAFLLKVLEVVCEDLTMRLIDVKEPQIKKAAIQKVKEMYGIITTDDVAEAILIAKYRSDMRSKKDMEDFCSKNENPKGLKSSRVFLFLKIVWLFI